MSQGFQIPKNYNTPDKLEGLIRYRNIVEALIVGGCTIAPLMTLPPYSLPVRFFLATLFGIIPTIICLFGIDGMSLSEYLWNMFLFLARRRNLKFRRTEQYVKKAALARRQQQRIAAEKSAALAASAQNKKNKKRKA